MPDFNPFDMDFDGNVDGIDFVVFEYVMPHVLGPDEHRYARNAAWQLCTD